MYDVVSNRFDIDKHLCECTYIQSLYLCIVISAMTLSCKQIYTTLAHCSTATNMSNDISTQSDESAASDTEDSAVTRPQKQQPGSYQRCKPMAKKPKLDPVDAQIMTLLRQDDEDKSSVKDQDLDRSFFLSLYQDYRALPSNIKVGVKIQLMQILLSNCSVVVWILTSYVRHRIL